MNNIMNLLIGGYARAADVQTDACAAGPLLSSEQKSPSFQSFIQSLVGERPEVKWMGSSDAEVEGVDAARESLRMEHGSRMDESVQMEHGSRMDGVGKTLPLAEGQQEVPQGDILRAGQQTREEKPREGRQPDGHNARLLTSMLGSFGVVQQAPAQPAEAEHITAPVSMVAVIETGGSPVAAAPTAAPQPTVPVAVADTTDKAGASQVVDGSLRPEEQQTQQVAEGSKNNQIPPQTLPEKAVQNPQRVAATTQPEESASVAALRVPREPVQTPSAQVTAKESGVPEAVAPPAQQPTDNKAAVPTSRESLIPLASLGGRQTNAEPVQALSQAQGVSSRAMVTGLSDAPGGALQLEAQEVPQVSVKPVDTANAPEMNATDKHIPAPPLDTGLAINSASQAAPAQPVRTQPAGEIGTRVINQIVKAARTHIVDGGAAMTLRLDPPHLGTVRMNVIAVEGTVTAALEAGTESARRIIEANLPILRESLAQAGVNVDSINVSVNNNQDYGWRWNGRHGEPGNGHPNAPWSSPTNDEAMDDPHPLLSLAGARPYSISGFDYLA